MIVFVTIFRGMLPVWSMAPSRLVFVKMKKISIQGLCPAPLRLLSANWSVLRKVLMVITIYCSVIDLRKSWVSFDDWSSDARSEDRGESGTVSGRLRLRLTGTLRWTQKWIVFMFRVYTFKSFTKTLSSFRNSPGVIWVDTTDNQINYLILNK